MARARRPPHQTARRPCCSSYASDFQSLPSLSHPDRRDAIVAAREALHAPVVLDALPTIVEMLAGEHLCPAFDADRGDTVVPVRVEGAKVLAGAEAERQSLEVIVHIEAGAGQSRGRR